MLSLAPLNDLSVLAEVLTAAQLPAVDLTENDRRFWQASDLTGNIVGYGGLEGAGVDLLLRSVIVLPTKRGTGLGSALVNGLLHEAKAMGAKRVWLMTTDAAAFFTRLGFERRNRTEAPEVVAQSQQFTKLCPASAAILAKSL